ncbi:hypothetical protein [Lysinibacillus sp. 54212]|uniref:hypothetical protein n=1 Tax=Lysinibacillus sp. 54212 TaxID=3119829 RepID=UPI002FC83FE2
MRVFLNVEGMSQWSDDVRSEYHPSACGPTTAFVILNYLCIDHTIPKKSVNDLYKILGGTKIGLFKWRLIKNLRKVLGPKFHIASCHLPEALEQLRLGYPVAMKFDQYFSFQWFLKKRPLFKYHWVPLIGYEIKDDELYLIIHDNGGPNRESEIRSFRYEDSRSVVSFVKIEPKA